ncbi:3199_t:CDS:2 [Ambispora gerdemannii]|uniref:3199_t:CDS:1 n=1 Tax=Ambispora gerdemannii TaxID=144530 RepID=A0A9N8V0Y2_9GLOM|nr:3199_t:CDS:2 [Ambispora gerdemannii]
MTMDIPKKRKIVERMDILKCIHSKYQVRNLDHIETACFASGHPVVRHFKRGIRSWEEDAQKLVRLCLALDNLILRTARTAA